MDARLKSAVLWGAVGTMTFLVLVQGYALAVEPLVSLPRAGLVALVVGVGTAAVAYRLESRVARWAAERVVDDGADGKRK
ncbi:hypothetical protein [Natronosalvus caseinilyticus]|uniref:hypothetical protein n=1 Tax=Natronosalvus caseinilyticus TaxID=2953747 RepID=UPI0028AB4D5C|nr:hypothetical protein [Natronosalvus caseinilyticus]